MNVKIQYYQSKVDFLFHRIGLVEAMIENSGENENNEARIVAKKHYEEMLRDYRRAVKKASSR